ncbi:MAG: low molecular weight protein-tyrosine-phosphatase [Balneolaceae bacterium]|nr:low molecular weight protein-tyrosine-phosphatase [Balneolaceae bacterium]
MLNKEITREDPLKICFVCLGNICRSPTAQGIFQHLVNEKGLQPYFEIDSAGTASYHTGEPANARSQEVANRHGVTLQSTARQFEQFDLEYYDLILAMDRENLRNIEQMDSGNRFSDKVAMLRDFDPDVEGPAEVPDPYHGGMQGFERVFDIVQRSCENLLDKLQNNIRE